MPYLDPFYSGGNYSFTGSYDYEPTVQNSYNISIEVSTIGPTANLNPNFNTLLVASGNSFLYALYIV